MIATILVYAYSIDEQRKQKIVDELLNKHDAIIISTQTVNEFINVTLKKKMLNRAQIDSVVEELFSVFSVELINKNIITKALGLASKYHYTHYDSLMLASALAAGCSIIYSEDMHSDQVIENTLKLINPF